MGKQSDHLLVEGVALILQHLFHSRKFVLLNLHKRIRGQSFFQGQRRKAFLELRQGLQLSQDLGQCAAHFGQCFVQRRVVDCMGLRVAGQLGKEVGLHHGVEMGQRGVEPHLDKAVTLFRIRVRAS